MKRPLLLICALAALTISRTAAQSIARFKDFQLDIVRSTDNLPYDIDFVGKAYRPLQRAKVPIETKQTANGKEYYFKLSGNEPTKVLPKRDSIGFAIKSDGNPVIALYKLQSTKAGATMLGWLQKNGKPITIAPNHNDAAMLTASIEGNVYQLVFLGSLPAGEYCFANKWDMAAKDVYIYRFTIK